MQEASESTPGVAVYKVAVRLPPFWTDRPALWFAQAEAQFELAAITSDRKKFDHISQLDHRHAAEVEDVITSPTEREPYKTLKSELVRRLSTSREQRVPQLLMHEEMGDRKPSQFLWHLKSLAQEVPDDFLRSILSSRPRPHIQAILAGLSEGDLDSASQLADRICEVGPQLTTTCVCPACENASIVQRLEKLSRQVASLSLNRTRRRSHSRSRRTCRNTPPQGVHPAVSTHCWYHRRFGDKAQKCTLPYSFRQQENRNSRRHRRQTPALQAPAASSSQTGPANKAFC
jgi:hypothetical protein